VYTAISRRHREAMPALVDCMLGQTIRVLTISTIMRINTNGSPSRSCAGMIGVVRTKLLLGIAGSVRRLVSEEVDDDRQEDCVATSVRHSMHKMIERS